MYPYRDATRPTSERVEDLLTRMTLKDKAGLLFHDGLPVEVDNPTPPAVEVEYLDARDAIHRLRMNHFNIVNSGSAREIAGWTNAVQRVALETDLGIPVTFSTDPRSAFTDNPATSMMAGSFSQWPESPGFAAIGDEELMHRHADIVRQEYVAVGIRVALHPQIDLATEPRWSRINGTYSADPDLTARLVRPYLQGLQGRTFGSTSVSAMTKHFPGGGPQKDGLDPHFSYGREQVYPSGAFRTHLLPFIAAIEAGTRQIMPYYGLPRGLEYPEVGFAFNKPILTNLLRDELGFDGIVCSDWSLLTDMTVFGLHHPARAWGVEHLSPVDRVRLALDAGVDQFGGEHRPELIVQLVEDGRVEESRIDLSVRRLLREKFELGLFDDPFVDEDLSSRVVGRQDFIRDGLLAQSRAITLLKNEEFVLPLRGSEKVYLSGVDPIIAAEYANEIVASPQDADVSIVRLQAPYEPVFEDRFEKVFHNGRLHYTPAELAPIASLASSTRVVIDVYLDRPAILSGLIDHAAALTANFGASDRAYLDTLYGRHKPEGSLPFELPSSEEAVSSHPSDLPHGSSDPLFPFGFGLRYPS